MRPGAHLSHAARLAFEAQRVHLASLLHLEAAGIDIEHPDLDLPALLVADEEVAVLLQALADEFGNAEVERLAAPHDQRKVSA